MKRKTKKLILLILILTILIVIVYGINKYMNYLNKETYVKIKINGQEIILTSENTEKEIDLEMLNTKKETTVKVELKNATVKINNKEIKKNKEISIGQIEISNENKIKIEVKKIGEYKYTEYLVNTLPAKFPKYTLEGHSEEEGEYYLCTYMIQNKQERHYIYKLNNEGKITFYKQTKDTPFNFKKNEINGKIRYTYVEVVASQYGGMNSALPTKLVVLDENYNQIDEIRYQTEKGQIDTENHDYLYLDDNHYIIAGYTREKVYNVPNLEEGATVWNCRIQEVLDGKIQWEFQSIKYDNLYEYYNEADIKITHSNTLNYMHFNSMKIDPEDGNLICSFRNIDSIIKISRQTGEIMWILGGKGDQFGLTEEQKFFKQHSISFLSNHEILLFDNAYENYNTRILKIKLDEKNKTIEKYESYKLDEYIPMMGAVQAINEEKDIYLVTYGIGDSNYAFKELNIKTLEASLKFQLEDKNILYCVNKYKD